MHRASAVKRLITALLAVSLAVSLAGAVTACAGANGGSDAGHLADAPVLRVGTSGDYAPYSVRSGDGSLRGIDIDVAHVFASEEQMRVEFVPFRWPTLVADLEADRFDVAMSGVTVRPERSIAGTFSVPVDRTGAVALVRAEGPADLAALAAPGRRIAVNAGGHLERVTRARFPDAVVRPIADNTRVVDALIAREVDAVVTDTREAPHWQGRVPASRVIGPFSHDRKAYWVRADQPDLAARLDRWLLARAADGTLGQIRMRHGESPDAVVMAAAPLAAVLAAIDERLALMPWVAAVKQRRGLPIEVPEREAHVINAAVAAVHAAARDRDGSTEDDALRALFRAQIEAAKAIQRITLEAGVRDPDAPLPDLDTEIRPALIRIGDRISRLVVALPRGVDPARVRTLTRDALTMRALDAEHVDAIASALVALTAPEANASAGTPAQ